jgi:hypothetical protein
MATNGGVGGGKSIDLFMDDMSLGGRLDISTGWRTYSTLQKFKLNYLSILILFYEKTLQWPHRM